MEEQAALDLTVKFKSATLKPVQVCKNLLGTMVKAIAKKCRKRKLSDQWSRGKQKSSQREASRQLDIVKMLRDLRAPASDSEGYTHDNETSDDETVK